MIEWKSSIPPPSDSAIAAFESRVGLTLTSEHRWFIENVTNGGRPISSYIVPTTACPGGASALHGVYGIDHPIECYDLEWMLSLESTTARTWVPFGFDDTGGNLYIDLVEQPGRIIYVPSGEGDHFHSAESIHEFLSTLVLEEDDD